jgi:type IV pilus assembly protein PilW
MAMSSKSSRVRVGSNARAGQHGLTLVELMVALAVGLFIALGIGVFTVSMGRQFRTTGSNTAADINTQVALSMVDDAGRSAGAGLFNNSKPLCSTINAYLGGATVYNNAVFMPARITDGGSAGASDIITFTQGHAAGGLSSMPVVRDMATADAGIVVSSGGTINSGELALVGVPGGAVPCTLFQVTSATTDTTGAACDGNASICQTLQRVGGSAGVNPTSAASAFTASVRYGFNTTGVSGPAVVTRLGPEFRQTAFRVMCGSLIVYNAFKDAPSCSSAVSFAGGANALVSDVVLVHAQYGISNAANSDVVVSWVDASGSTWTAPTAGDAARVRAIRLVMVTRSKEPDSQEVSATCTNTAGVANTGPCSFDDAAAPVINVSALAVATGRNWKHYRYRTHQAVIPLRSVIWSM